MYTCRHTHVHTHTHTHNTCESLMRNSHASREYTRGYSPVDGLQELKLVQGFN